MKIKEISVGVSRTFNLGDYNSLRVEATVAASVEDGTEIEGARHLLLAEVRETLRRAYVEFKPQGRRRNRTARAERIVDLVLAEFGPAVIRKISMRDAMVAACAAALIDREGHQMWASKKGELDVG